MALRRADRPVQGGGIAPIELVDVGTIGDEYLLGDPAYRRSSCA
jgi:hypothetical protein